MSTGLLNKGLETLTQALGSLADTFPRCLRFHKLECQVIDLPPRFDYSRRRSMQLQHRSAVPDLSHHVAWPKPAQASRRPGEPGHVQRVMKSETENKFAARAVNLSVEV